MAGNPNEEDKIHSLDYKHLIPSHVVVQQQLQDLVRIQNSLAMRLRCKLDKKENFIAQDEYEAALQELEEEKLEHLKTKARLSSVEQKLEYSLHEVDELHQELKKERDSFQKVFGNLKEKALVQNKENEVLLGKCTEMEKLCIHQDDVLTTKDIRIRDLKTRLAKQKDYHRTQMSEVELTLQQERYLAQQLPVMPSRPQYSKSRTTTSKLGDTKTGFRSKKR